MIIAIDHGNVSVKTNSRTFKSGIRESDTPPPFGDDTLKYNGKYYTLSDKRIPFMRAKFSDERFFVLSLFAIAFEIEDMGRYEPGTMNVHVLAGLPPAHFGSQFEEFEEYFKRGIEEFEFHGKKFKVNLYDSTVFPQAFAAVMPIYNQINTFPRVTIIDIGGFTADYLIMKNGEFNKSNCGSLEHGVIHLYNKAIERINSDLNLLLDESDIDIVIRGEPNEYGDDVKNIIYDTAEEFISDLFGKLRERSIDLRSGRTVFVGGGSILLRKQIEASGKVSSPIFVDKISANAKGYELLYKATKARR
ncbi:MAG: ParM/StbA family protein [Oscillospiraceae bacterium]|nr:ParM/StbA family protein [Oscillospiraceae bacterium]